MFEKRALSMIFGPKKDEVTEQWRGLHNKAVLLPIFRNNSHSNDRIKKNTMGGACGMYEGKERCLQGFGEEI